MAEEQKNELSEKDRRFLEEWKKAREADKKLPPEELAQRKQKAQELWDKATLGGRID